MKVLAVIPARGGSQRVTLKNIAPVLGRPALAYTLDHARAASTITRIVVSTEDDRIARIAHELHAETILRPAEFATAEARLDHVLRHAVATIETRDQWRPDVVVMLYGAVPVRPAGFVDRCVNLLSSTGAHSVRSLSPVHDHHPLWTVRLRPDSRIEEYLGKLTIFRRQDLPPAYFYTGACLAFRTDILMAANDPNDNFAYFGADQVGAVHEPDECIEIHEADDIERAEWLLRKHGAPGLRISAHDEPPAFDIGGRRINAYEPVYVIAEAGVNHDGSIETAHRLIDAAADAKADAVKFQAFSPSALCAASAPLPDYVVDLAADNQRSMLEALALPAAAFRQLRDHARERNIHFLCSAFDMESLLILQQLELPAYKFASTELTNDLLIDEAARIGRPLLLSTGAATIEEIHRVMTRLAPVPLLLFHCVSSYPTADSDANLATIADLKARFGRWIGFSDHTRGVDVAPLAVAAGAVAVEKHFTLDPSLPGPDHHLSLDPTELTRFVAAIRRAEQLRGRPRRGPFACEANVREVARKSLTTTVAITAGSPLRPEDLTTKRPGTGIAPERLREVIGRRAKHGIPADTVLSWEMIE